MARLLQRVFNEGMEWLVAFRHVVLALGVDGKTDGREQLVEFLELAGVVGGENEALGHVTISGLSQPCAKTAGLYEVPTL